MAKPKVEAIITVPTGGWSVSVEEFTPNAGPVTVTVPAATYYLTTAGSGSNGLIAELVAQLTANATLGGTYAGSLADTADSDIGTVSLSTTGVALAVS